MDCPKLKNHVKGYIRNKKAMVATWGDSEDERSCDEAENDVANLFFMALEDEDSTQDEVTTLYEELESAFTELQDEFTKDCTKNNVLK